MRWNMTIQTVLILNSVMLIFSIVAITFLLVKWLSAEKKLARHNESKLYTCCKKQQKNNKEISR